MKLFEKTADGLLVEIAPERAAAMRAARPYSTVALQIDVLLTDAEVAQREAESDAALAAMLEQRDAKEAKAQRQAEIAGRLGLTTEEVRELLG